MNFDDNAEYRQADIFAMDDLSETDPREVEATLHHLNYIGLEGNIGCLGNQIYGFVVHVFCFCCGQTRYEKYTNYKLFHMFLNNHIHLPALVAQLDW